MSGRPLRDRLVHQARMARRRRGNLRPTRQTVHRAFYEDGPPTTDRFGRWDGPATLAPPADVPHPDRVFVGRSVLLLEGSALHAHRPEARIELGDRVLLARYCRIDCVTSVRLGDGVMSSDFIAIVDHIGRPNGPVPPAEAAPVTIEDGAYLGYGCIVGPGVTVGAGAFVGEGSVVLDDVPAQAVVYGNPATVVRSYGAGEWRGSRFP